MPTASVYPLLIDSDTQLLRRTLVDAIVPADHNNLVDAIEAIEATVGPVEDGSASLGARTFALGLADYVGFPSVASNNPRYPWLPIPAEAWYAAAGALPATWTLGAGVTASYSSHPGYVALTPNTTPGAVIASVPLAGSAPFNVAFRFRHSALWTNGTYLQMGFASSSTGTGMDGISVYNASQQYATGHPITNEVINGAIYTSHFFMSGLTWLKHTGTAVKIMESVDGLTIGPAHSDAAHTMTPTHFVIRNGATAPAGVRLYLSFVTFGATDIAWAD